MWIVWYTAMEFSADGDASAPVPGVQQTGKRLSLAQMSLVAGSNVMRGELVERGASATLSSGSGYGQTRNFLFVDTRASLARWLLPDDDHVVTEHSDVETRAQAGHVVGTFALVKSAESDLESLK